MELTSETFQINQKRNQIFRLNKNFIWNAFVVCRYCLQCTSFTMLFFFANIGYHPLYLQCLCSFQILSTMHFICNAFFLCKYCLSSILFAMPLLFADTVYNPLYLQCLFLVLCNALLFTNTVYSPLYLQFSVICNAFFFANTVYHPLHLQCLCFLQIHSIIHFICNAFVVCK